MNTASPSKEEAGWLEESGAEAKEQKCLGLIEEWLVAKKLYEIQAVIKAADLRGHLESHREGPNSAIVAELFHQLEVKKSKWS